ncbi:MAG: hypothetical protein ACYDC5_10615 [Candidatus Dormibacteria bacterium]
MLADRIEHATPALPEAAALSAELARLQAEGMGDACARLLASTDRLWALYDLVEAR